MFVLLHQVFMLRIETFLEKYVYYYYINTFLFYDNTKNIYNLTFRYVLLKQIFVQDVTSFRNSYLEKKTFNSRLIFFSSMS